MNRMNAIMRDGLTSALAVLFDLSEAGCTVTAISVRGGKPVLVLDAPPTRALESAVRKSYRVGRRREAIRATVMDGCQVEWIEPQEPRPRRDSNVAPMPGEPYRNTVVALRRRTTDQRA